MKTIKTALLALGAIALLGAAPAHAADGTPTYGVININKIIQTTDASKGVIADLDAKRKEYQDQIEKQQDSLRTEEQSLADQKAKLSAADFDQKRKDFQAKVEAAQKQVQDRKAVLDKAANDAMGKLRTEILKVTADIAKAKGFTAVFNQEALVLADPKMDITDEVIAGVNKNIKKIPVTFSK